MNPDALPWRAGVGVALFSPRGLVWTGLRRQNTETAGGEWQMPQGGIDADETPAEAALRELEEETGAPADAARVLAESESWLCYDLPPALLGVALRGRYRGQRQKWFAMRFLGDDAALRPQERPAPEFDAWAWRPLDDAARLIVPFKRAVYREVARMFARFASAP